MFAEGRSDQTGLAVQGQREQHNHSEHEGESGWQVHLH